MRRVWKNSWLNRAKKRNQFFDIEKGCEKNPEFDFSCDGLEEDLGSLNQAQNPSIIFYAIYRWKDKLVTT